MLTSLCVLADQKGSSGRCLLWPEDRIVNLVSWWALCWEATLTCVSRLGLRGDVIR